MWSGARSLRRFRLPGPDRRLARFLELVPGRDGRPPVIADLGSGGRRLPVPSVGLDARRAPDVDVQADALRLPIRGGSCDGVVVTDVLMYVADPFQVAAEVRRILRPGGIVYAAEPFLYPHLGGGSRFRFTVEGLRAVFDGFEELEAGGGRGAGAAALPILAYYASATLCFNSYALYRGLVHFWLAVLAPLVLLDWWVGRYRRIPSRVYTNAYFLGRWPGPTAAPRQSGRPSAGAAG